MSDLPFVHQIIDLMLDGGPSLADNDSFKAAQAALPKRVAMGYLDVQHLLSVLGANLEDTDDTALFNILTPYAPSFLALSASFLDEGIKLDFYCPTPEALASLVQEPNPLNAASIIPGTALGLLSTQNLNALWQEASRKIAETPANEDFKKGHR